MELRSLAYFVRIAELGSITRAAAHLHLAQPALTRHVQRLEDELGVPLLTRANRGVKLTEAGQKLLESAARILREVERTGDEIRAQDAHPSGRIIFGITPTLCPVLVPELSLRMRRDYPRIELKAVHAGMVRLEEFVIDGRVDIALLSELSRSRLVLSTRLAQEEMVLVTEPGARLRPRPARRAPHHRERHFPHPGIGRSRQPHRLAGARGGGAHDQPARRGVRGSGAAVYPRRSSGVAAYSSTGGGILAMMIGCPTACEFRVSAGSARLCYFTCVKS